MGCVYCHKHTSSEHHRRSKALGFCRPSKLPLPPIRNVTAATITRTPAATSWNLSLWAPKDVTTVSMVQSLGGFKFDTPEGRMVTRRVMKLVSVTGTRLDGLEYFEEYGPKK